MHAFGFPLSLGCPCGCRHALVGFAGTACISVVHLLSSNPFEPLSFGPLGSRMTFSGSFCSICIALGISFFSKSLLSSEAAPNILALASAYSACLSASVLCVGFPLVASWLLV